MELTSNEFALMKDYIYEICGLFIEDKKKYLITQRLGPIAESTGCSTFESFYKLLTVSGKKPLIEKVISAITTNETFFFRDIHPFQAIIEHIFPMVVERKYKNNNFGYLLNEKNKIRIWCTAASTGQEPYSVAMLVDEFISGQNDSHLRKEHFSIFSTDISPTVLEQAKSGRYTQAEVMRGVSADRLERHFTKKGDIFELKDTIRNIVKFAYLNLSKTFPHMGLFDLILCRNVLIYFDERTRTRIFEAFSKILSDDGILILGASENTYGVTDKFVSYRYKNSILYRKTCT